MEFELPALQLHFASVDLLLRSLVPAECSTEHVAEMLRAVAQNCVCDFVVLWLEGARQRRRRGLLTEGGVSCGRRQRGRQSSDDRKVHTANTGLQNETKGPHHRTNKTVSMKDTNAGPTHHPIYSPFISSKVDISDRFPTSTVNA
jgi:hypothetical protein